MKHALILHGTGGNPDSNWFPWLKQKFEAEDYKVWAPLLPGNDKPDRTVYGDFLFSHGWDFTDSILVGHSSGAVEVLNLLIDDRLPKVRLAVMVSAWRGGMPEGFTDASVFANTFPPDSFDLEMIKSKAEQLTFIHGADDPYCPIEGAKELAAELDAPLTVIEHGGHVSAEFTKLPELWSIIQASL